MSDFENEVEKKAEAIEAAYMTTIAEAADDLVSRCGVKKVALRLAEPGGDIRRVEVYGDDVLRYIVRMWFEDGRGIHVTRSAVPEASA